MLPSLPIELSLPVIFRLREPLVRNAEFDGVFMKVLKRLWPNLGEFEELLELSKLLLGYRNLKFAGREKCILWDYAVVTHTG